MAMTALPCTEDIDGESMQNGDFNLVSSSHEDVSSVCDPKIGHCTNSVENDAPERSSFLDPSKSKSRQHERKTRLLNTIALYSSYMLFGFCVTALGPALIDLKELLRTDTKSIVLAFTFNSGGFIIGSFGVMMLIGRINYNLLLSATGGCVATLLAVMPWMPSLALFVFAASLSGIASSALHTTAQVYLLVLWNNSKHCHSLMQGMHGVWSIAATIGPFILEPFLSKGLHRRANNTGLNVVINSSDMHGVYGNNSTAVGNSVESETMIQYGFLTLACVSVLAPVLCILACLYEGKGVCLKKIKEQKVERETKDKLLFRIVFVLMISCLFSFYIVLEVLTGTLIATFVVEGLGWQPWKGPIITSVYWGSFGLSRLLAIIIAKRVAPERMMAVMVSTICASFLIMALAISSHEAVTWVFIAVIGAAEGPFFAAGMVIVNKLITLDGPVSAILTVVNSCAIMVASAVGGYMFEEYGHISLIYYLLANSFMLIVAFIVVLVFAKCSSKLAQQTSGAEETPGCEDLDEIHF